MPSTEPDTKPPCHLGGLSVLVTRPAHQAEPLCDLISSAHGRPIRFPTLEILGPEDKAAACAALATVRDADLVIFVSANAVQYAFPLLPNEIPLELEIAAIGRATARQLDEVGLPATLTPERMDSEGLLALPGLERMAGRRVIVLRGNGGRELIAETLSQRGAEVQQIEVYRRRRPHRSAAARNLVSGWDQLVDVVITTSNAVLDNLFEIVGEAGGQRLRETPVVVVSRRMAEHAAARGCKVLYIAKSAQDGDLLQALCDVNEDVA